MISSSTQWKSILVALDWRDYRIIEGVARYAAAHHWHLSNEMLLGRNIAHGWCGDGAITGYGPGLADFIVGLDVPKVDVTIADIPLQIPRVVVDDEAVGILAADHLRNCGFRNFAYYGYAAVRESQRRRVAYRDALMGSGVTAESIFDIRRGEARLYPSWHDRRAALARQLDALPKPIGVYSGQERLAANLVDIAVASGYKVPEEIAVLGTDNIHYICECQRVPLSSIDTRPHEHGYRAAEQLDRLMRGEIGLDADPILIQPAGVVRRRSTDVVAVSHPPVSRTLRYLRDHFQDPITVQDLLPISRMSERGLQKAFVRVLGRTPGAELRRLRLRHAKRLLRETDEKVAAIAQACGYSTSTNLGAALKREAGMTPRAYRRSFSKGVFGMRVS